MSLPQILRLNETRSGIHCPNSAHRTSGCTTLVYECADKSLIVLGMRIPMAIECTKACSRQGLVDGRVVFDPRISPGHASSKIGQAAHEGIARQVRTGRP